MLVAAGLYVITHHTVTKFAPMKGVEVIIHRFCGILCVVPSHEFFITVFRWTLSVTIFSCNGNIWLMSRKLTPFVESVSPTARIYLTMFSRWFDRLEIAVHFLVVRDLLICCKQLFLS